MRQMPVVEEGTTLSAERELSFLSRRTYTYLGKDVVVMLDVETKAPYLVDVSMVDVSGSNVQRVDVSLTIQPYGWEKELETLVPDVETARRNILHSFLLAGAFDTTATQTRVRNDMFNSACPYKKQFFAGE